MNYKESEIKAFVEKFEQQLMSSRKVPFSFDRKWSSNFPSKAGIYAIFDKNNLVYIGETANIKERMKELKRTYNHSFRKKLGRYLVKDAKIIKGKFEETLEIKLNDYYLEHISIACKALNFGRLEVESQLIHKNEGLLNSKEKRNQINK